MQEDALVGKTGSLCFFMLPSCVSPMPLEYLYSTFGGKCVEVLLRLGQYKQFSSQFRVSVHPIGTRNHFDSFPFRTFSGLMDYRLSLLLLLSNLNDVREPSLKTSGKLVLLLNSYNS